MGKGLDRFPKNSTNYPNSTVESIHCVAHEMLKQIETSSGNPASGHYYLKIIDCIVDVFAIYKLSEKKNIPASAAYTIHFK